MSGVNAPPVSAPAPSAPSAPSAPAPAPSLRSEVPVNPNPVASPQPVGSQAPPSGRRPDVPRPSGRPESRREAIQRAFDKANEQGRPGAAQARIGHNQPPPDAQTPPQRPQPPAQRQQPAPPNQRQQPQAGGQQAAGFESSAPFNLRQPPPRKRGERGRFVASDQSRQQGQPPQPGHGQPAAPAVRAPQQQWPVVPQLHPQAPYRDAIPRMSDRARYEWAAAPESVRGEVYRMHNEFMAFHHRARQDIQTMDTIRQFDQLARSQGTTLQKAMTNYVTMENRLRSDPLGGLATLVHNMNLRTSDGYQITLRDIAHYIATQSPEAHQAMQTQNLQQAHNSQITRLEQTVSQLANSVQAMHNSNVYSQRYGQTRSEVDRFAATHPRLDELGDTIVAELKHGYSLEQAYQRAHLLRPPGAAPPRAQTPGAHAAQTRIPDRSISGAPDGGANRGTPRRNGPAPSRRDAITSAMRRVNGSL